MICRHLPSITALLLVLLTGRLAAELRVATYNVRNYLMTNRQVFKAPGAKPVWRENYPKPENEKSALRNIIAKVDPDILALQEMGAEPYLKEFQRDMKRLNGVDYPHTALMIGADEDRHVAVLSKIPIGGAVLGMFTLFLYGAYAE